MESESSTTSSTAILQVVPVDATLDLAHELSSKTPRALNMRCILGHDEAVYTQKGQSLAKEKWSAYVVEADAYNENASKNNAVGLLVFQECQGEHATCSISFALRAELFDTLLSTLKSGSKPAQIEIEAKGLSWALPPRGGIEWNVDSHRVCPISSVRLNIPLANGAAPDKPLVLPLEITGRLQRLESRVMVFGVLTLLFLGLMQLVR